MCVWLRWCVVFEVYVWCLRCVWGVCVLSYVCLVFQACVPVCVIEVVCAVFERCVCLVCEGVCVCD